MTARLVSVNNDAGEAGVARTTPTKSSWQINKGEPMKPIADIEISASGAETGESASAFRFDHEARRYSIDGPVGLKDARLGIEADGMMLWADDAAQATWSERQAKFEFTKPPLSWHVRFHWRHRATCAHRQFDFENRGESAHQTGPVHC